MEEPTFRVRLIGLLRRGEILAFCTPNQSLDDPTLITPEYKQEFVRLHPDARDVTAENIRRLSQ